MTKTRYYLLHPIRQFILSSYKKISHTNSHLNLQVIYIILFIFYILLYCSTSPN
jgi:hypothetical protein